MAIKQIQGLLIEDGEPFRINGVTYVLDGEQVMTQKQYDNTRARPKPLCALCDTDQYVRICADCSQRLRESLPPFDAVDPVH